MSIETIAAKIGARLAGSGFDRSVRIDLPGLGSIMLEGESARVGDGEADCVLRVAPEDFEALVAGDIDPTSAFMSGKLAVEGDLSAAMALGQLL